MIFNTRQEVHAHFCALVDFYGLYDETNDARHGVNAPAQYHGRYHTECVTALCSLAAERHALSYDDTRDLLIAAVFHDFRHSGGRESDSENHRRVEEWIDAGCRSLDGKQKRKLKRIISATEYPFKECPVPYPIEIQILRDADIMQSVMPDWPTMYRSLQLEVSISVGRVIPDIDWRTRTNQFYRDAKLFTGWSPNYIEDVREHRASMGLTNPDVHMGWLEP